MTSNDAAYDFHLYPMMTRVQGLQSVFVVKQLCIRAAAQINLCDGAKKGIRRHVGWSESYNGVGIDFHSNEQASVRHPGIFYNEEIDFQIIVLTLMKRLS